MSRFFRLTLTSVFLLGLVLVIACKKDTGSEKLAPVPLARFQWGQSLTANEQILKERGFERGADTEAGDPQFMFRPPEVDPENLPGVNPYEITLFTREDRLVAARYIRRDVPEILEGYESNLLDTNKLKLAWKGDATTTTTPAGNVIAEQTQILENAEFLVKNTRTSNKGAEERFAAGLNDELETQIFAKNQNEGITADRLKPDAGETESLE